MAAKSGPNVPEASAEILMLGYLCIKGADNLVEKVGILDRFGLADTDIALICGSAAQSVRNARQKKSKSPETNT
jgi:hypothetical protein